MYVLRFFVYDHNNKQASTGFVSFDSAYEFALDNGLMFVKAVVFNHVPGNHGGSLIANNIVFDAWKASIGCCVETSDWKVIHSSKYYVYDIDGQCVSDSFVTMDSAIAFAKINGYNSVKIHRYRRDDTGGYKLYSDGCPETVWIN